MTTIQRQFTAQWTQSRTSLGEQTALWFACLGEEAKAWQCLARGIATTTAGKVTPDSVVSWSPVAAGRALERNVLTRADSLLTAVSTSVSVKLASLEGDAGPTLPMEGYLDMTARAIVAEVSNLDSDACEAVLAYEAANKKRSTVLRAAEQQLAC